MEDSGLGLVLSPDFGRWPVAKSLPKPQAGHPSGGGLVFPAMPVPSADAQGRKSRTIYVDLSEFPDVLEEFDEVRHRCRFKSQKDTLVWLIRFAYVNDLSRDRERKED